jgi:hypothetical protein
MSEFLSKLIRPFWLAALLLIVGTASSAIGSVMQTCVIPYDEQNQTSIAYDAQSLPHLCYDFALMLSTKEDRHRAVGENGIFDTFAQFLAADTGVIAADQGCLNLFKWGSPTTTTSTEWISGDYFLNLPNQGSAQANWIQHSSRLRGFIGGPGQFRDPNTGQIRDASGNVVRDQLNPLNPLNFKGGNPTFGGAAEGVTTSFGELRAAGLADAHHVIQDAAVRDLAGYDTLLARGVQLPGPSTAVGTPHYIATQIQRQAGGGTLGAEMRIGYKALRQAGLSEAEARQAIAESEAYFNSIGATRSTPTRIPGNR